MNRGIIDGWDKASGYGFIRPIDGSPAVFMHARALPDGMEPKHGELVEYLAAIRDRGPYAKSVRQIEG